MPGMDFIVGLPDIAKNYVDLLTSMLQSGGDVLSGLETDMREGDIRLWSDGEVEESPEELATPMPVSFEPILAFMETGYDEARSEYFKLLVSHVGDQLSSCEKFLQLLKSDIAVD